MRNGKTTEASLTDPDHKRIRVLEIGLAAGEVGGAAGATMALHQTIDSVVAADLVVARASGAYRALAPSYRGSHLGFILNAAFDRGLRKLTKPRAPFVWGRSTIFAGGLRRAIDECDLVQVYWNDRLLGVNGLEHLVEIEKPMVLVPMDFEPLTGGCHYPLNGCEGYRSDCSNCPVSASGIIQRAALRNRKAKKLVLGSSSVCVVAGNEWFREHVVAAGCARERTRVVYTPVAPCYHEVGLQRLQRGQSASRRSRPVITIGATDLGAPRKRIADAIEIARRVGEVDASLRVVIVGRNCPEIPSSLRDHVEMVGLLSEPDLADILGQTDVFISTATEDGGPMMLAAAWSAGAAVAATPIGYASDLLTEGLSGKFLREGHDARAVTVMALLKARAADPIGSIETSRLLGDRFTNERAIRSYLELYKSMLQ